MLCTDWLVNGANETLSRSNRSDLVRHSLSPSVYVRLTPVCSLRASDCPSYSRPSCSLLVPSTQFRPVDPCRVFGLRLQALGNPTLGWDSLRVLHRTPSNELDRHEPSARLTFIAMQSILHSSRCIYSSLTRRTEFQVLFIWQHSSSAAVVTSYSKNLLSRFDVFLNTFGPFIDLDVELGGPPASWWTWQSCPEELERIVIT